VPSLLTGGLYMGTTWGTTNFYYPPAPHGDTLGRTLQMVKFALLDYFAGNTHDSFWGQFGWMDTPLVIKGRRTNTVIRFVIQTLAWVLLALTLLRLEQVVSRFVRVARAGRARAVWRMMVSDPLVNSYFLFTVFMVYLYVRVENRFGAQGRNWLPLILPIFLVGIRYAPRALSLRWSRVALSRTLLAGLVLYCVLGSYYALPTLKKRYYVPARPEPTKQARLGDQLESVVEQ